MTIKIGIVGDYDQAFRPHTATNEALLHAADVLDLSVHIEWLPTLPLEQSIEHLAAFDALWCAPGSPYRSLQGALNGVRFARESQVPLLATCGGFQHVVIEYARHVLGFEDAQHAEYNPYASTLFISELTCSPAGQTMQVRIDPASRVANLYGQPTATEQYYCNFGLNPAHQKRIDDGGLRVVGTDQDGEARILEIPDHPFYIATLFVPQMHSTPDRPHPLILSYLKAAVQCKLDAASI